MKTQDIDKIDYALTWGAKTSSYQARCLEIINETKQKRIETLNKSFNLLVDSKYLDPKRMTLQPIVLNSVMTRYIGGLQVMKMKNRYESITLFYKFLEENRTRLPAIRKI